MLGAGHVVPGLELGSSEPLCHLLELFKEELELEVFQFLYSYWKGTGFLVLLLKSGWRGQRSEVAAPEVIPFPAG